MDLDRLLSDVAKATEDAFVKDHLVLSFDRYLELLAEEPYSLTRDAATYLRDLFDHFGRREVKGLAGQPIRRFRLFDDPENFGSGLVYGQEEVQNRLYEVLNEFVERGRADRFIMLHGPNGSAKSSLVEAIRNGLEIYSQRPEGALYRFSWIFCEATEKEKLGFGAAAELEERHSFADVDEKFISSRMPSEMKDPPFFFLPRDVRQRFLEAALTEASEEERARFRFNRHVLEGQLSPKDRVIHDRLLESYRGDWRKVLRHVRVERYRISHRYRSGAVTIEPQGTIDASARLLGHASMSGLPPVLAHETLAEAHGDLVDANGGLVEYSDFLKRNMEANKYLLTTAERGFVNLSGLTISLNLVLLGTSNEKYLAAFKRDPSFTSFKGRFELIRVPYLLEYKKEARIYERHLRQVARGRHVAPHTAVAAALWAVLTRLRRPDGQHWEPPLSRVVEDMSPIEKARLYDRGELPKGLDDEERKHFRQKLDHFAKEFVNEEEEFEGMADAAYEGRRGASPREVMNLLTEMAVDCERDCITPVEVFEALPRLIADRSLYSFLRIPRDGEYHDPSLFIDLVRREYLRHLAGEIQRASDLIEESEYRRLFMEYVRHVRAHASNEKVQDPQTGAYHAPDEKLMQEVEEHLDQVGDPETFRSGLMSKVAAFRLSNPDRPLVYEELFADLFIALEESFFRERKERILDMVDDCLVIHSGAGRDMVPERRSAAENLFRRMQEDFGYTESSASRVLAWFQRHFDELEA